MKKRGYVLRAYDEKADRMNADILIEGLSDCADDLTQIVAQMHMLDFPLLVVTMRKLEEVLEQIQPGTKETADALEQFTGFAWAAIPVKRKPEQEAEQED